MIGIALALTLFGQEMTPAQLVTEGEDIGRALFAMGVCKAVGYTTHDDAAMTWGEDFGARATAAGFTEAIAQSAIEQGIQSEQAETDLPRPGPEVSPEEFRARITGAMSGIKSRCRRLSLEHSALISNLDQGERNADAQLAILMRPLDR
jgi:hypothetical protein